MQQPALIMAFDFGLRRIGVATGGPFSAGSTPRRALHCPASGVPWPELLALVRMHGPDLLLVGAPYNDDGTPSRVAAAADRFATELGERSGLPVQRVDERYSSVAAAETLRGQRASGERKRRLQPGDLDSAAAAVILDSWLHEPHRTGRTT